MITNNDPYREKMLQLSINNFREQSYKKKHLVILNHGPRIQNIDKMFNITQIHINKMENTLGDIRNMAFEYVPYDGLFCVWDDDDYRRKDFLSTMYDQLIKNDAKCVCFTNRLEYNINTNFGWQTYWGNGFVHVLATKNNKIKYLSKNTMEDVNLINDMKKIYKVYTFNNDPTLYLRIVHNTNTSLYANATKETILNTNVSHWKEFILTKKHYDYIESEYIQKIT
jgi:hypothetical protein